MCEASRRRRRSTRRKWRRNLLLERHPPLPRLWEGWLVKMGRWMGRQKAGIVEVRWRGGTSSKRGTISERRGGSSGGASPVLKSTRSSSSSTTTPEGSRRGRPPPHRGRPAAGGGRDEGRPDPGPCPRLVVAVEGDAGAFVDVLSPPVGQWGDHRVVLPPGADIALLSGGEAHPPLPPLFEVVLVVKLEVFAELPPPALLLPPGCAVVRQVRVGVIVEEARHRQEKGRCRGRWTQNIIV